MAYGELYLPPEVPKRNAVTGRFMKGHVPHNKNKKTGAINTDHRYLGVRFYFEDDDIWTTKIK